MDRACGENASGAPLEGAPLPFCPYFLRCEEECAWPLEAGLWVVLCVVCVGLCAPFCLVGVGLFATVFVVLWFVVL